MLASDVMADAAVLLNDREQVTWTNVDLLPFLQKAHRELSLRSKELGIQSIEKISTKVEIPTTKFSITATDITDLSYPIKLEERLDGSSDLYSPMTEVVWSPQALPTTSLNIWSWQDNEIKLIGATTAREVIVYYKKNITEISTAATPILDLDTRLFLGSKTAAFASALAGGNFERANVLAIDAEAQLQAYFNTQVKSKQIQAIRHKGYRR